REGAGRAYVFAEVRGADAVGVQSEKRQQNDESGEDCVFEPLQETVPGEVLALPKERDFIKQILNEPEGAQPAAHEASEGRTHQQKKADEIERQAAAGRGECGLQRTKRAGAERAGAGIAVQSRNAEI